MSCPEKVSSADLPRLSQLPQKVASWIPLRNKSQLKDFRLLNFSVCHEKVGILVPLFREKSVQDIRLRSVLLPQESQ